MPKKKKAPRTSRKKAWLHAFYLVQPFMQFFALMAIILFLARCVVRRERRSRCAPAVELSDQSAGAEGSECAARLAAGGAIRERLTAALMSHPGTRSATANRTRHLGDRG